MNIYRKHSTHHLISVESSPLWVTNDTVQNKIGISNNAYTHQTIKHTLERRFSRHFSLFKKHMYMYMVNKYMKNIDFIEDLDNHFTEKLNINLDEIKKRFGNTTLPENEELANINTIEQPIRVYESSYRENDSPLTMSINSDYEENYTIHTSLSDDNYAQMNNRTHMITSNPKVLANAMNVINIYCKSQKYMYEQASIITQYQHNAIYGITISFTSSVCIFITFMETPWKNIIIIIINAIVSVLIVVSKYLKLETSSELYLYISKQFEVIYNMSNKLVSDENAYLENSRIAVLCRTGGISTEKMKELEDRIAETIDIPSINIPQIIQKLYPITANINIFAFSKKVDAKKDSIAAELQKTNMELQYIVKKYGDYMGPRESQRYHFLLDVKKTLKTEQANVKNAYAYMEELITLEINKADFYRYNCMRIYFSASTDFAIDHSHCNPFVDEYIRFIIPKYK